MSRRLQTLSLAVGVLVVPLVLGSSTVTQAQPAATSGSSSSAKTDATDAHPYSDPDYFPVRQTVRMDCFKKNPGCEEQGHDDWQLTVLSLNDNFAPKKEFGNDRVYAMGAGRVMNAEYGKACVQGGSAATTFGTQIDIDHGGGVSSRYGHFDSIATNPDTGKDFAVGDLVDAGQFIGVMGNTGANGNCKRPYLDLWVKQARQQVDFGTLKACVDDGLPATDNTQIWPKAQYDEYDDWNQVRKYDNFPNISRPSEVPDGSCLPAGEPATVKAPDAPRLKRAGIGTLKASWTGQPAGTVALAYLEVYRVTTKSWSPQEFAYVKPGVSSYTFKGLAPDGARARIQLSYKNGFGWSKPAPFVYAIIGAPSDKPTYRAVTSGVVKKTGKAFIRLGWSSGKRHGFEPTGYVVEIRQGKSAWVAKRLPKASYGYLFAGLKKKTAYQVRVKSTSGAGDSAYLTRSVTTPSR